MMNKFPGEPPSGEGSPLPARRIFEPVETPGGTFTEMRSVVRRTAPF